VAGGEGDGEAEGEEDAGGTGEEDGAVAGVADEDAGDGASEEERESDEGVVGAQGSPAIFDGDVAHSFDDERREDQGETNSNECGGNKRGRGNPRGHHGFGVVVTGSTSLRPAQGKPHSKRRDTSACARI
jgi:hypothetical protein